MHWSLKKNKMTLENIQYRNEVDFILRYFIDRSAKLLPILYILDQKENPLKMEIAQKNKIMKIFRTIDFPAYKKNKIPESTILTRIRNCFDLITQDISKAEKQKGLIDFLQEYNRLKESWRKVELN
ncbi:MAG: hypothetical protein RJA13_977 [Bacteroidota bacterium]|jgi:hypothetical protein